MSDTVVEELVPDQWQRLRTLRLASLQESGYAFGGNLDLESAQSEVQWRDKFAKLTYLIVTINAKDIALMSVENLVGDFGATAWIGGCWTNPRYRGQGVLRAMFNFVDQNSETREWKRQGLGVWEDNYSAIAAYEKLGFVAMGDPQESTRVPGKYYQRMIRDAII